MEHSAHTTKDSDARDQLRKGVKFGVEIMEILLKMEDLNWEKREITEAVNQSLTETD